ncbi:MAG: cell division protein SepF [Trebonia sp.]|uniref:cell division protein SepF n=1 Tax=Trebonia sp. TaxID=2767075 RepID=UPI003BAEC521
MASAMRKMAVYLGLVEDDRRYAENYEAYDEYDDYDEPADAVEPATPAPPPSPSPSRADYAGYPTDHRIETVPPQQVELARITTLHPRTYNEARNIGEHFRDGTPVIMNLTEMVDSDARRLVDFAAGLIFGLRGSIDKVTNKVFLLSPANVEVTAEDKARIAERGFFNQS